jgi:hypothetical protein
MKIKRGLLIADEFRRVLREMKFPEHDGWTHEKIGERTRLSAGFIGMILSGAREPSKAILDAVGFERVVFYRMKN